MSGGIEQPDQWQDVLAKRREWVASSDKAAPVRYVLLLRSELKPEQGIRLCFYSISDAEWLYADTDGVLCEFVAYTHWTHPFAGNPIDTLSERESVADWHPIETAPRDCSAVLVAWECELRGWTVKEAWWGYAYEGAPPKQCSWRYDGNKVLLDKSVHGLGAAYWMPLPRPPHNDIEGQPL